MLLGEIVLKLNTPPSPILAAKSTVLISKTNVI